MDEKPYRITVQLTVNGEGAVQRAAMLAQQIVGSMYVPFGMEPPAYEDARIVVEPVQHQAMPDVIAERLTPMLRRWASKAAILGPSCVDCGHRKVMHDLGVLHVDDRGLTSMVDCLECYIEATNNPATLGTAGRCHGYRMFT